MTHLILALCLSLIVSPALAFPNAATVVETFTGTDGTTPPNSNWTNDVEGGSTCGIQIVTNAANPVTSSTNCSAYYNPGTYGPDMEAYVTWTSGSGPILEVFARLITPGSAAVDGYKIRYNFGADTLGIFRIDNGTATLLGANPSRIAAVGDAFGISVVGSTIKSWYKASGGSWVQHESVTDSTYSAAGYTGLFVLGLAGSGGTLVDGFAAGTMGTARRPLAQVIFQ